MGCDVAVANPGGFPLRYWLIDGKTISEDLHMTRNSRLALLTLLSVNSVFAAGGANPLTGLPLPGVASVMFVGSKGNGLREAA
jgi:hypothetical protein